MKKISSCINVIHIRGIPFPLESVSRMADILQHFICMKRGIITLVTMLALSIRAFGDSKNHKYQDADYKNAICSLLNGKTEVVIKGHGRADCVTDKYAMEVEFVDLWEQGVEQTERYAKGSKKEGLLALVAENEEENTRANSIKSKLRETNSKINVRVYSTEELKDFLPKNQVCAKLSNNQICHLVNTGAYAMTEDFVSFDSYSDCIKAGGSKPKNVGIGKIIINAKKAYENGICKNFDMSNIEDN